MVVNDVRVRRPKSKEPLMQSMRDEGGFATYRDVLIFAAAVGFSHDRRVPFEEVGEPIRYEVLADRSWAAQLVDMLGIHAYATDPEIMSEHRLQERVRVFEEYANGGLEYLGERLSRTQVPMDEFCATLVIDALIDSPPADGLPSAEELAQELDF